MKVALVHDWLTGMRGGEKCLEAFLDIYPKADIFTLVHVSGSVSKKIEARVKKVSCLNKIPRIAKFYRYFLPFFPFVIKNFKFENYDLVISLSHAAAKNVVVPKGVTHICYCFTPMRYIWDQVRVYFGKKTPFIWPIVSYLRNWDKEKSLGVSRFVAISNFIKARVRCYYKRSSEVIYPPVDTSWLKVGKGKGKAFLYAGALVPYKKVDKIIEAFNQIGEEIWIVGKGPELQKLKRMAKANIIFKGFLPDEELAECYANCRALLFPALEDFGIIPVEAQASGRPVIALKAGGAFETVKGVLPEEELRKEHTGVFIKKSTDEVGAIIYALNFFIKNETHFSQKACIEQAKKFSRERFYRDWEKFMQVSQNSKMIV